MNNEWKRCGDCAKKIKWELPLCWNCSESKEINKNQDKEKVVN